MQESKVEISDKNRFSVFVKGKNTPEHKALIAWQEWFTSRGIASELVLTTSGFALYREGLIEVDIYDQSMTKFVSH